MADEIQLCSPKSQENEIKQVSSPKSQDNEIKQVSSPKCQDNGIKLVPSSGAEAEKGSIEVEFPHMKPDRAKLIEDRSAFHQITSAIRCLFKCRGRWRKYMKLPKQNSEESEKNVTLVVTVMSMFSGATYLALFSFHDAFPISAPSKIENLSTLELLTFPKAATDDFLVIVTVSTLFIFCMGVITFGVCSIFRKFAWGTFLTILSLFAIMVFILSFFAMLNKIIPHSITIAGGNLKVQAIFIVIFYDIYVIGLVCTLACIAQRWSSWCKQDGDANSPIIV